MDIGLQLHLATELGSSQANSNNKLMKPAISATYLQMSPNTPLLKMAYKTNIYSTSFIFNAVLSPFLNGNFFLIV